jgi:hypothetical protein
MRGLVPDLIQLAPINPKWNRKVSHE